MYVVAGDAGNDDWVEMEKRYEMMNFSEKIAYGTGYGVVSADRRNLTYEHYKVADKEKASIVDKFTLY